MKARTLAAIVTLMWAASLAPAQDSGKAAAGPRIRVEPATFDFGRAAQNKTLNKEFSIRNFGTQDLVIESVSTTCGCTVAGLEDKVIKPGGTAPLRVSLETRAAKGRIVRSVMVRSNDPATELFEVKVEATVVEQPEK